MQTETTEQEVFRGWICFDAECGLCTEGAFQSKDWFTALGYKVVPIQSDWVFRRLGCRDEFTELVLISPDDQIYRGADVVFRMAREVWWAKPIHWLSLVPGVSMMSSAVYRHLSARRKGLSRVCGLTPAGSKRLPGGGKGGAL